ncbi:hypothetical protein DLNHIDIE_03018 [Acidithiobacillus thiooxidans ATCC 19377]|uniref:Uncharacterized protein n=1 Tax=Acidithiobacillus thiooxidans ATCC 19377 TaxID=637390 RepID=A0A543PZV8_ACITH|nr:hypothetical protein DLNHIDIE_03018 [Acidithiobacillus thiooxidans ATCC 19377]
MGPEPAKVGRNAPPGSGPFIPVRTEKAQSRGVSGHREGDLSKVLAMGGTIGSR